MKISVELSDYELREICEITGVKKKGPAIRKLLEESLRIQRRACVTRKFLTGEWSAESKGIEASRRKDRRTALTLAEAWRD